jgi:hypothetical protein
MKSLLLFLISFSAMASNWMPLSKIQSLSTQAYQLQSTCEATGEQCLDVGEEPGIVSLGFVSLEDNYLKSETLDCVDVEDCSAKFLALVCPGEDWTKIQNNDLLQVYCVKLAGKKLVKDLESFDSYKASQASLNAQKQALGQAKSLRECGSSVMDLVLVRNASKGLNTTQVKAMVGIYAPIKGLLETGSLNSAKEEVQAVEPDGTLVTSGDKVAVISAIDVCLGL